MTTNLTPKQDAFCKAYIETGNASEAYRRSYTACNMTENTLNVQASKMLKHPKISLRLKEIAAHHAKRHEITVDHLVTELEEARALAMKIETPSAAVAATMGKGKLLGLIIEKNEHTGKDGQPIEVSRVERIIIDPNANK